MKRSLNVFAVITSVSLVILGLLFAFPHRAHAASVSSTITTYTQAWDHEATVYVSIKDVPNIPLTSMWLTIEWNSNGSSVTAATGYVNTEAHSGATVGTWSLDPTNEQLGWTNGCFGCSSLSLTGKTGFNYHGPFDHLGSFYNTLQLVVNVSADGSWTYSVQHWIRSDAHFGYSWGGWWGSPNDGPWWDRP